MCGKMRRLADICGACITNGNKSLRLIGEAGMESPDLTSQQALQANLTRIVSWWKMDCGSRIYHRQKFRELAGQSVRVAITDEGYKLTATIPEGPGHLESAVLILDRNFHPIRETMRFLVVPRARVQCCTDGLAT